MVKMASSEHTKFPTAILYPHNTFYYCKFVLVFNFVKKQNMKLLKIKSYLKYIRLKQSCKTVISLLRKYDTLLTT